MLLKPLEAAVLKKLLDGDHPALAALRDQLPGLSVKERRHTGTGFFTEFSTTVAASRELLTLEKLRLGDVQASIRGLEHGAGFLLYVDQGPIHFLEGYSYEEAWPEEVREFAVKYSTPDRKAELEKLG